MAARWAGRKGRPWRKVQARVYSEESHCVFCGGYVHQDMVNYRSRWARSVHHLIPPDIAPGLATERGNLRLAHLGCNSSYGRGQHEGHTQGLTQRPHRRARRRWARQPPPLVTSRLW